jgi:ankyrin repeat protein
MGGESESYIVEEEGVVNIEATFNAIKNDIDIKEEDSSIKMKLESTFANLSSTPEVLNGLLKHTDNETGNTLLHFAINAGSYQTADSIIQNITDIDVFEIKNKNNETPIEIAFRKPGKSGERINNAIYGKKRILIGSSSDSITDYQTSSSGSTPTTVSRQGSQEGGPDRTPSIG